MFNKPDNNLYIVTAVFNPFNFNSRYRLYQEFADRMEYQGAKLITIEAAFGVQDFKCTSRWNKNHIQVRTNQVLWHKERLINKALEYVYKTYPGAQFVGWVDSDVTFANDNWVDETVHRLSYLNVVQPFSMAANLDPEGRIMWTCPSSLYSFLKERGFHQTPELPVSYTYKGHPGLAWTARADYLQGIGGIYDLCVAGSADSIMTNTFKGDWTVYLPAEPTLGMRASMRSWADRAGRLLQGKIGYTPGTVLHHWHGNSEERGYEKRWSILSYHGFDPAQDLMEYPDGMLKWRGNKPKLEADIRLSLNSRNEDSVDIVPTSFFKGK